MTEDESFGTQIAHSFVAGAAAAGLALAGDTNIRENCDRILEHLHEKD